jgi:hypothetical protein
MGILLRRAYNANLYEGFLWGLGVFDLVLSLLMTNEEKME